MTVLFEKIQKVKDIMKYFLSKWYSLKRSFERYFYLLRTLTLVIPYWTYWSLVILSTGHMRTRSYENTPNRSMLTLAVLSVIIVRWFWTLVMPFTCMFKDIIHTWRSQVDNIHSYVFRKYTYVFILSIDCIFLVLHPDIESQISHLMIRTNKGWQCGQVECDYESINKFHLRNHIESIKIYVNFGD